MVIAGATAAQTNVLKALQNRRIYYVSLCKLIILPVAGFLAAWILNPPPIVLMTVTIAAACPAATMCTMFAVNLDKDPKTASEIFTVSLSKHIHINKKTCQHFAAQAVKR